MIKIIVLGLLFACSPGGGSDSTGHGFKHFFEGGHPGCSHR